MLNLYLISIEDVPMVTATHSRQSYDLEIESEAIVLNISTLLSPMRFASKLALNFHSFTPERPRKALK
jgi:hypothetical protein